MTHHIPPHPTTAVIVSGTRLPSPHSPIESVRLRLTWKQARRRQPSLHYVSESRQQRVRCAPDRSGYELAEIAAPTTAKTHHTRPPTGYSVGWAPARGLGIGASAVIVPITAALTATLAAAASIARGAVR